MADVQVNRVTNLVSTESLAYMRPIRLHVKASLLKPNTKMYAYFDGVDVSRYFTQTNVSSPVQGAQLVTSSDGIIDATFDVPGKTFTAGEKTLVFSEYSDYSHSTVHGASDAKAKAVFKSTGLLERYQTTETSTHEVVIEQVERIITPVPVPRWGGIDDTLPQGGGDPLAQSFFTFGVAGGCFISSIDLFFANKDATLPVWVEIREMINGYPSLNYVSPKAVSFKLPTDIAVSTDASLKTNFAFEELVYLQPDRDYCFVVQSRSNQYNLWTSRMGEKSIETGNIVFNQPYTGSLFKSENNYTWTAEQNEDIKFVMYRADFNTSVNASLNFAMSATPVSMDCTAFQTVTGSNYVYVGFHHKHNLDTNSKIAISLNNVDGVYNGIPGANLAGTHAIYSVLSEYVVAFVVTGATATSTGPITTGGYVIDLQVDNHGSGYNADTPPVVHLNGIAQSTSNYSLNISGGKLLDIVVKVPMGTYTTVPSVTLVGGSGSGASATAIIEEKFLVSTNRVYHSINPSLTNFTPNGTEISATLDSTLGSFEGGTTVSYVSNPKTYDIDINKVNSFDNNLLLASRFNEYNNMQNRNSANLHVVMSSTNSNISPVIDGRNAKATFIANSINNQSALVAGNPVFDTIDSTSSASNTELTPYAGHALSRYITKKQQLANVSSGIRLYASAYSNYNSSFEVYIKTSMASSGIDHDAQEWKQLSCNVSRNKSTSVGQFLEYEFYSDSLSTFDTFSIKFVLRTLTPWDPPIIDNYRTIVLAS